MSDIAFVKKDYSLPSHWKVISENSDWQLAISETECGYQVSSLRREAVVVCILSLSVTCDAVLTAYKQFGHRFIEQLRRKGPVSGMIWNTETGEFLVFRDILGFMPWMVADGMDGVISVTSSPEIHGLVTMDRAINRAWLAAYLRNEEGFSREDTLCHTRRVIPGEIWVYREPDNEDITRSDGEHNTTGRGPVRTWSFFNYWDTREYRWHEGTFEEIGAALREEIMAAVSRIPVSDPLFTLSGGLDSTGILASWLKLNPQRKARAFSLISHRHASCDESPQLDVMEQSFPIELTRVNMDEALALSRRDVYDSCWCYGPVVAPGIETNLLLYDVMAQEAGSGTIIVGNGGNSIVGVNRLDYVRYVLSHPGIENLRQMQAYLPLGNLKMWRSLVAVWLGNRGNGQFKRWYHLIRDRFDGDSVEACATGRMTPLFAAQFPEQRVSLYSKMSHFEKRCWSPRGWHWEYCVRAIDRMTRQTKHHFYDPLYDPGLYDFCAQIPPVMMVYHGKSRSLYREALRPLLPEAIVNHRKCQHFDDNIHDGLGSPEICRMFEDTFEKKRAILGDLLDMDGVESAYRRYFEGEKVGHNVDSVLWRDLSVCLWYR